MNAQELAKNPRLTQAVVHDLNRDPRLPFGNAAFDAVLCTVEVFTEVARVLAPGGLFLVVFSNRMFKTKAVKSWRDASDPERKLLLEDYFCAVDTFEPSASFVSQGRVRPPNDRYAGLGIPSDPVWAVYAETHGGDPHRIRRSPVAAESDYDPEAVARRKQAVKHTLRCPYCDAKLDRFDLPLSPFCEWPNEYMYVCFNNDCPYLVEGWQVMNEQGNPGISYRLMYNPDQDRCLPVAEASVRALGQYVVAPRG